MRPRGCTSGQAVAQANHAESEYPSLTAAAEAIARREELGEIKDVKAKVRRLESICRILREQGCQVAARTYRDWARAGRPVAARTIGDATVTNRVRDLAWRVDHEGVRRVTAEGLSPRAPQDDRARVPHDARDLARVGRPGDAPNRTWIMDFTSVPHLGRVRLHRVHPRHPDLSLDGVCPAVA